MFGYIDYWKCNFPSVMLVGPSRVGQSVRPVMQHIIQGFVTFWYASEPVCVCVCMRGNHIPTYLPTYVSRTYIHMYMREIYTNRLA